MPVRDDSAGRLLLRGLRAGPLVGRPLRLRPRQLSL